MVHCWLTIVQVGREVCQSSLTLPQPMILKSLGRRKRVVLFNDAQLCGTVTIWLLHVPIMGHGTFVTA